MLLLCKPFSALQVPDCDDTLLLFFCPLAQPGGFLAYEPNIPLEMLGDSGPRTGLADVENALGHLALVNYQLREVRARPIAIMYQVQTHAWPRRFWVLFWIINMTLTLKPSTLRMLSPRN
jgi:hypothetical protein